MNISCNNIGDKGFAAVASCIDKIDELDIGYKSFFDNKIDGFDIGYYNDRELSIDGVIVLCNAIQNQSSFVSEKTICLQIC